MEYLSTQLQKDVSRLWKLIQEHLNQLQKEANDYKLLENMTGYSQFIHPGQQSDTHPMGTACINLADDDNIDLIHLIF